MRERLAALTVAMAITTPALSHAGCLQHKAIYSDVDGAYELSFEPIGGDSAAASHRFKMKIKNSSLVLDGYIMPSEPLNRSNGLLFNNCPEGDVTGKDLTACTVWEGPIYASATGKIELLPSPDTSAAPEILLAGFGSSLVDSSAWGPGKATVPPWDVFSLKGCQP